MLEGTAAIADFLGVGYDSARKWMKYDGLPAILNQSGRWFTSKRAVVAWILEGAERSGRELDPDLKALLEVAQQRVTEIYEDTSFQQKISEDIKSLVSVMEDISESLELPSNEDGIEKPSIKQ
jgi:hypothetical protein